MQSSKEHPACRYQLSQTFICSLIATMAKIIVPDKDACVRSTDSATAAAPPIVQLSGSSTQDTRKRKSVARSIEDF